MKKWNLPLTYAPKIPKVLDGTCTQTIRIGRKFSIGDLVSFHGWEGKPYRSKWSFRTPYWELIWVGDITAYPTEFVYFPPGPSYWGQKYLWNSLMGDRIAYRDGIEPTMGDELGRLLNSMHKIDKFGKEMQIIRWRFA